MEEMRERRREGDDTAERKRKEEDEGKFLKMLLNWGTEERTGKETERGKGKG